jgi:hypothetical protein
MFTIFTMFTASCGRMARPRGWKEYPLLRARRVLRSDGVALLTFWCPFCKGEHTHGAGHRPGDGDGHRVAHCHASESPFLHGGYVLWEETGAAHDLRELK